MITVTPAWHARRTDETKMVEKVLGQGGFDQVDAYRYNSASIRVRVVDRRFEGSSREKRDALVEEYLDKLPPDTQRDIVTLFTFAPSEIERTPTTLREFILNTDFEHPRQTRL